MDPRLENLLKNGKLPIIGSISKQSYEDWRMCFKTLESWGSPDIEIDFDSTGGSYNAGKDMASLVRMYKGKTTGIVLAEASSMAFLIWQVCDKRVAFENAYLCPHQIATTFKDRNTSVVLEKYLSGDKKQMKILKSAYKEMLESDKKLSKFLSEKSTISVKQALKLIKKDEQLPVKKAFKLGFVDEIIPDF